LRHLSAGGHELVLVTFLRPEEREHLPVLEDLCYEVHSVPIRRSLADDGWNWLKSNFSGRPFLVERDDKTSMRMMVNDLLDSGQIDAVHVDQLTMGQFVYGRPRPGSTIAFEEGESSQPATRRPWIVFDAHNAVWTILDRMSKSSSVALRPLLTLETRRVKLYEGGLTKAADVTLVVSERDRECMLEAEQAFLDRGRLEASGSDKSRISVIPIAVDTEELKPIARQSGSLNIITLGTLHYPPNADGIRWFLESVFPLVKRRVPGSTLTIVGKNPPRELMKVAAQFSETVAVEGYVPDLTPYLQKAAILVVPVRVGGGMRVRILEAFARAMPTVTTSVGLEGIQADQGEHVLVADDAQGFADHVVNLLEDEVAQARLAVNGRWLAEARYDRMKVLTRLGQIYEDLQLERP
jgi:glycosyltransferase involved in cell wall biosynthesis